MKILKRNNDFIFKKVKNESVLLNAKTGDYFGLNEVGTDFYMLIDGKISMDEIIEKIMDDYNVNKEVLQKDIGELVDKMLEKGILLSETTI